jgi:cephalosporin hydroxylase
MSFNRDEFDRNLLRSIESQYSDQTLKNITKTFIELSSEFDYAYQFKWMGLPIIQLPEDILTTQEVIFKSRPDYIIDIGVAWGGGIMLSASVLEMIGNGHVIGIDKTLPEHVYHEIMNSTLSHRITLIRGDSTSNSVFSEVEKVIKKGSKVSLILDSNHEESHVYKELCLYSPFVNKGQYITVYATAIDNLSAPSHRERLWGKGNSPLTALNKFLDNTERFEQDDFFRKKCLCSFAPSSRIKCVK